MTPEQIAEIGVSGKGYWLFDRNDNRVRKGEGFKVGPELNTMAILKFTGTVSLHLNNLWAIYKWIPSHRS